MTNDKMMNHSNDGLCGGDVLINGTPFRTDHTIFQGTDSRIFSAHSLQGGGDSAFVIKCFHCVRNDDVWNKAMHEIEAAHMLRRCRYIVGLLGHSVRKCGGEEVEVFLLFDRLECLDGTAVTDRREILAVCRDISLALEAMRRKGLIHGDVKPSNIYRSDGRWLLGDLGSVCLSGEVPVYGSEGYYSPESARSERCDIRSDIYSLGITCYRLLSGGRLPFCDLPCGEADEGEVYRAIERRLGGEAIPPVPGVNDDINKLILKMCEFDRRSRFRKPSDVASAANLLINRE